MADGATLEKAATTAAQHFDVLIVGAGISGVGAAYHLTQQMPGHELRGAGEPGELRRHLAHPQLSRHPLRQRPLHLRLSLQAVGRRRRSPPARRSCKYMGEVIEENDLDRHIRYRHADRHGQLVERRQPLDRSRPTRTDTGETERFTANFLWMCQGYYRHAEGYTPEWAGHGRLQGPHRPPADLAGGPRLQRQEGGGDRLGRHRRDPDPGHRRRRARTSPCCSARRPISSPAATSTTWPTSCASWRSTRTWIHEIVRRQRSCTIGQVFTAAAFDEPEAVKQELLAGVAAYHRRRTTTSPSTSRRATGPGASASPSCPTATSSRAIKAGKAVGRHRRDRALHRDGHPAEVGRDAGGRHHRHRHRLRPQRAGRHRLHRRRQAARFRRHRHLPRHDVHRRAEHGLGVRLFPRQLDPARRPDGRLRLPAAGPHAGARARARSRSRCGPRTTTCRCCRWIDPENFNPGYLMRGMHLLPKRGDKPEWQHTQDYWREKDELAGDRPRRPGVRLRRRRGRGRRADLEAESRARLAGRLGATSA